METKKSTRRLLPLQLLNSDILVEQPRNELLDKVRVVHVLLSTDNETVEATALCHLETEVTQR
ncbi:hypothetical protein ACHAXM_010383 [Skeletonema potamos]